MKEAERDLLHRIGIVVPCYNESGRLDFERLSLLSESAVVFVDDGSTDETAATIRAHLPRSNKWLLLELENNHGKAEAVRRGMLRLSELPSFKQMEWVGFLDADLSTDVVQIPYMIAFASLDSTDLDAIWGARVKRFGSRIERRTSRHYSGRAFATLVSILLGITGYDTQCGAKLFRKACLHACFDEPFVTNWVFDLELCYRLKRKSILECPLQEWHDIKGSKVKLFGDLPFVVRDLFRIRNHYGRFE